MSCWRLGRHAHTVVVVMGMGAASVPLCWMEAGIDPIDQSHVFGAMAHPCDSWADDYLHPLQLRSPPNLYLLHVCDPQSTMRNQMGGCCNCRAQVRHLVRCMLLHHFPQTQHPASNLKPCSCLRLHHITCRSISHMSLYRASCSTNNIRWATFMVSHYQYRRSKAYKAPLHSAPAAAFPSRRQQCQFTLPMHIVPAGPNMLPQGEPPHPSSCRTQVKYIKFCYLPRPFI